MPKQFLLFIFLVCLSISCNSPDKVAKKTEKIDRKRCSFNMPASLYFEKIDSSFSEEGYFKIASDESNNVMQLFVFDSKKDPEEEVNAQIKALNAPGVFTSASMDEINRFGNYSGKGVILHGEYAGGLVKGAIRIFSYSDETKSFLVIRQTINKNDSEPFDIVENSLTLK